MNTSQSSSAPYRGHHNAWIRPAWTPITIAMMIVGFMIFWPLGLAMLAYILWGDRLEEFKSGVNRTTDGFARNWSCGRGPRSSTGNVAFDDWRNAEIERLREERRKLEEMRAEFEAHLRELRRAKDQDEFDAFMSAYKRKTGKKEGDGKASKSRRKSVPDS
ncbi:DUF2852 domain-containing protein [Salaquimonas pukyongi]|uniref:DUF2852 domain-containing protein n=1 Tax=Salaquimonas pukyongi TaxID=2712698 RepID=UPI00096BB336|nr:DUF2852 domain-containing protein [Salaquimonas pukyongi]